MKIPSRSRLTVSNAIKLNLQKAEKKLPSFTNLTSFAMFTETEKAL